MACNTPVALFGFNRPDLTARVFAEIRRAQPPQLFLVADGPRSEADKPKCQATRRVVQEVDWPCKLHTNFSETNLGCGHRVSSGLDWVFSQVEEAIILEDDCLPCPAFFNFCDMMLAHYRKESKVMHVAGSNFLDGKGDVNFSYHFSKYALVWGWATWRRAWQYYDFSIRTWPEFRKRRLREFFPDRIEAKHWPRRMEPIYRRERQDTWDYQWIFTLWSRDGYAITPSANLITNIGAGTEATHTKESDCANLPPGNLGELRHPPQMEINHAADGLTFDRFFGGARMRECATLRHHLTKPLRLWRKWISSSQVRFRKKVW
jgi:hypothetical protein